MHAQAPPPPTPPGQVVGEERLAQRLALLGGQVGARGPGGTGGGREAGRRVRLRRQGVSVRRADRVRVGRCTGEGGVPRRFCRAVHRGGAARGLGGAGGRCAQPVDRCRPSRRPREGALAGEGLAAGRCPCRCRRGAERCRAAALTPHPRPHATPAAACALRPVALDAPPSRAHAAHLPDTVAASASVGTATYSPRKALNLPSPAASPLPRAAAQPASLLLKAAARVAGGGRERRGVSPWRELAEAAAVGSSAPGGAIVHSRLCSHPARQPARRARRPAGTHPGTAPPPRAAWGPGAAAPPPCRPGRPAPPARPCPAARPGRRWAHPRCPAPPAPRCGCRPASWPARRWRGGLGSGGRVREEVRLLGASGTAAGRPPAVPHTSTRHSAAATAATPALHQQSHSAAP